VYLHPFNTAHLHIYILTIQTDTYWD